LRYGHHPHAAIYLSRTPSFCSNANSLDLTEREREVLALMVEGLNNTQIAARLTVSPSTIKSHVSNILTKLGMSSRTEAAALALRHKLVT
jgi:two-component system, NarL family, response regulator LiaR